MAAPAPSDRDHYRHPKSAAGGGILLNDDHALADRQKTFISRMVKRVGAKFLEGRSLTDVSLHVSVFEDRSYLERVMDDWEYGSYYLPRAAHATDAVERVKLVSAFLVAGLHRSANLAKPFNPLLGETFEAHWSDGTRLFAEQTSHHPPVTHWLVEHPQGLFRLMGFTMFNAKVMMLENSVKTRRQGINIIDFHDGGRILFTSPLMILRGLLLGERKVEFLGSFSVLDVHNGLVADFMLNPDAKFLGSLFSSSHTRPLSDTIRGFIYTTDPSQKFHFTDLSRAGAPPAPYLQPALLSHAGSVELRNDADVADMIGMTPSGLKRLPGLSSRSSSSSKTEPRQILSRASGTWLGHLSFDNVRYWDIRQVAPDPAVRDDTVGDPLPSDVRRRADVQELKSVLMTKGNNFDHAQTVKEEVEQEERRLRKLRGEHNDGKAPFFPKALENNF